MAITVARGTLSRIREYPDQIVIQVQSCPDPEAAAAALRRAADDIWNLDGGWRSAHGLSPQDRNNPKYVSGVTPAGTGPFLMIDGGYTPARLLRTIPDIVARHLAEAGVVDAVVAAASPGGPLGLLERVARAVVLRLYPHSLTLWRRPRLADGWIDEACAWVLEGLGDEGRVHARVDGVEFPLAAADVAGFLRQCREAGGKVVGDGVASAKVVTGDLRQRIRGVNATFAFAVPTVALAAGGPEAGDDELLAAFDALVDVARRLAPELAYAFVSVEPDFGPFGASFHVTELALDGPQPQGFDGINDQVVIDGFAYQVLSPGHLRRMGGPPPGAVDLGGGRVELAVGDPAAWLLDPKAHEVRPSSLMGVNSRRRDPSVQELARGLLAPCLVSKEEAYRLRDDWAGWTRSPG